jgi:hypothetical protein
MRDEIVIRSAAQTLSPYVTGYWDYSHRLSPSGRQRNVLSIYVAVDDAHYPQAKAHGGGDHARDRRHPLRLPRILGARPRGNTWSFGTYRPEPERLDLWFS